MAIKLHGPQSLSRAVEWCSLAVAAFGATWIKGPLFPHGNNVFHIPIALGYATSAEGPHDAFHESLSHFTSFFWLAVARIASEEHIEGLFLGLHFITVFATLLGAYTIAVAASVPRRLAIVATSLLAFGFISRPELEFGGGELLAGYLTHSQLATAGCLFSLALAIRLRWLWAAALCGLLANINLFLGFWLIVNLLTARALFEWRQVRRFAWRDGLLMGGACLLLALPMLGWALSDMLHSRAPRFSFGEYLYTYYPYHSFVHMQVGFFLAFAALCAGVWIALATERLTREPLAQVFMCALAVLLGGSLLPYIQDSRLIHDLFPLRYAAVVYWVAAIAVIRLWAHAEAQQVARAGFGGIAVLGFMLSAPGVMLLALMFLIDWQRLRPALRWVLLACAWIGVVAMKIPLLPSGAGNFPLPTQAADLVTRLGPFPTLFVICGGSALFLSFRSAASGRWLHIALVWLMASVTLISDRSATMVAATATVLAASMVLWNVRFKAVVVVAVSSLMALYLTSQGAAIHALLPLVFACVVLASVQLAQASSRVAAFSGAQLRLGLAGSLVLALCTVGLLKAVKNEFRAPRTDYDQNLLAAQEWARANTPPGSLFHDTQDLGFAVFSRRPVWWSERQGAAVMWEPGFYGQWATRRLQSKAATSLTELAALAREEGIQYVLLERAKTVGEAGDQGLELSYCNEIFCIARPAQIAMASTAP